MAFVFTSFTLLNITVRGVSNKHCLLSFFIKDKSGHLVVVSCLDDFPRNGMTR